MNLLAKSLGLLPSSWLKFASRAQWKHPLFNRVFHYAAARLKNQDGMIQQGVGKGLRFNAGNSNAGFILGTSEPGVQHAMGQLIKSGMTVYDVGANIGFLSVIAARLVGSGGRVICFEPLPDNVLQIRHNAQLNDFTHIDVRQEALGAEDSEAQFLVSSESTWGKLAGLGSVPANQIGEITVKVKTLDSVLASEGLPIPDLMKIDIEGAEAAMLAGTSETIRRTRPILMIELHGTNTEVSTILDGFGYRAVVIGSHASINESPWDAYAIAAPSERTDLVQIMTELSSFNEKR